MHPNDLSEENGSEDRSKENTAVSLQSNTTIVTVYKQVRSRQL